VTLEEGRIRPDDKQTMKLIIEAAQIQMYSVIINKLAAEIMEILQHPQSKQELIHLFNEGLPGTQSILLYPFCTMLRSKDRIIPITAELRQFVIDSPVTAVPRCKAIDRPLLKSLKDGVKKCKVENAKLQTVARERKKEHQKIEIAMQEKCAQDEKKMKDTLRRKKKNYEGI